MASKVTVSRRLRLPETLPCLSGIMVRRARMFWLTLLIAVVVLQIAGFGYALFDSYRIRPALREIGLTIEYDDANHAVARPLRADAVQAGIVAGARIERIGTQEFGPDAPRLALVRAAMTADGDRVPVRVRNPDGRRVSASLSRSSRAKPLDPPPPLSTDLRLGLRLISTLLCSLSLLGSSYLLLMRRPGDPEAMLFGIGFLVAAACVDPVLPVWMATGAGVMIDALAGLWWTLLVIALAAFPDGRFTPSPLRWSLVAAPLFGVLLASDAIPDWLSLTIAVGIPLLLLGAQILRYRRLGTGRERQQIKWAALGFASGFVLAGVSIAMSLAAYDNWPAGTQAIWTLATVCLFNLAFAILPLGLLTSLIRYRLWDVDRVISRSLALALITTGIGLLWAVLSDVAKHVVAYALGKEHDTLALVLGAAMVACVFAPTQALVVQWCKRRFNPASLDLEELPERLTVWREQCSGAEIAMRALDVAILGLHAPGGAILARTPNGRTLVARRKSAGADDGPVPAADDAEAHGHVLHLEDRDGLAGWLVIRPREDGSRYANADLAALAALATPLADAVRSAAPADDDDAEMHRTMDELRERLALLEQRATRPA